MRNIYTYITGSLCRADDLSRFSICNTDIFYSVLTPKNTTHVSCEDKYGGIEIFGNYVIPVGN